MFILPHLARNCPQKKNDEDTDAEGSVPREVICCNCGGESHDGGVCEQVMGRLLNPQRTLTNCRLFHKAKGKGLNFADIVVMAPDVKRCGDGKM